MIKYFISILIFLLLILGSCDLNHLSTALSNLGENVLINNNLVTPVRLHIDELSSILDSLNDTIDLEQNLIECIYDTLSAILESESETVAAVDEFQNSLVSAEDIPLSIKKLFLEKNIALEIENQADLISAILFMDLVKRSQESILFISYEDKMKLWESSEILNNFILQRSAIRNPDAGKVAITQLKDTSQEKYAASETLLSERNEYNEMDPIIEYAIKRIELYVKNADKDSDGLTGDDLKRASKELRWLYYLSIIDVYNRKPMELSDVFVFFFIMIDFIPDFYDDSILLQVLNKCTSNTYEDIASVLNDIIATKTNHDLLLNSLIITSAFRSLSSDLKYMREQQTWGNHGTFEDVFNNITNRVPDYNAFSEYISEHSTYTF